MHQQRVERRGPSKQLQPVLKPQEKTLRYFTFECLQALNRFRHRLQRDRQAQYVCRDTDKY